MEDQIREVMHARIQSEQLNIQHVRYPSEGMPVGGMNRSQGPHNILKAQAALDMGILSHIFLIIVIQKGMGGDRPVYPEG